MQYYFSRIVLYLVFSFFLADMRCAEGVGGSAHLDTMELCGRVYWWYIMDDWRNFFSKVSRFCEDLLLTRDGIWILSGET
jgi:hypothetical protein